jgi:hypothetical protein
MARVPQPGNGHEGNQVGTELRLGQEVDKSLKRVIRILPPLEIAMEFRSLGEHKLKIQCRLRYQGGHLASEVNQMMPSFLSHWREFVVRSKESPKHPADEHQDDDRIQMTATILIVEP